MTDYASGRKYRRDLDAAPGAKSNPDAGAAHLAPYPQASHFPVTHHGGSAVKHVETVGWLNGEFREASHPNAEGRRGTDSIHKGNERHNQPFDQEPQRRGRATGFNR